MVVIHVMKRSSFFLAAGVYEIFFLLRALKYYSNSRFPKKLKSFQGWNRDALLKFTQLLRFRYLTGSLKVLDRLLHVVYCSHQH